MESGESILRKTFELVSDVEGKISVVEPLGADLTLSKLRKDGYKIEGRTYFGFPFGNDKAKPPHVGDPNLPVIFKMRRVH